MLNLLQLALLLSGLLLPLAAQSCTSCGPECVSACGSRRYRTCCFNYLRRRRSPDAPGAPLSELANLAAIQDGLQLLLLPADRAEKETQYAASSSLGLLHRLLEEPGEAFAASGSGSAELTTSSPRRAAPEPTPPPAPSQHYAAGSGKDYWLNELRRRLLYNV